MQALRYSLADAGEKARTGVASLETRVTEANQKSANWEAAFAHAKTGKTTQKDRDPARS